MAGGLFSPIALQKTREPSQMATQLDRGMYALNYTLPSSSSSFNGIPVFTICSCVGIVGFGLNTRTTPRTTDSRYGGAIEYSLFK